MCNHSNEFLIKEVSIDSFPPKYHDYLLNPSQSHNGYVVAHHKYGSGLEKERLSRYWRLGR